MKAQHRHELETNTLAKELNVWSEKLRPYTSVLLAAVAAVLAFYAIMSMWNTHVSGRENQAWFEYERALLESDPDYKVVRQAAMSEDYAGSRMQEWAYVAWADRQLWRSSNEYLLNRESSKDRLKGVATVYEQSAENAENPEIRNRARLGLARVRELQDRLDDARKEYARVEGALQPIAEARLKELDANVDEMGEVVKWLATADLPAPAAPTGAGFPGVRPDFGATPPSADGAGGDPFDPAQTMEQILGGADEDAGRYEEGGATEEAAPAGETSAEGTGEAEPATDAGAADAEPAATAPAGEAEPAASTSGAETESTDASAPAGS